MKNIDHLLTLITFLLIGGSIGLSSCYRTNFYSGSDARLRFSTDTLVFDTVFTTVGSATRVLKVYNDLHQAVEISTVELIGGEQSPFRLNIDGTPGSIETQLEIGPGDSLYVFGEVTVDPDAPLSVSPFVIQDRLVFEVNGNRQEVLLEAWGQNANYVPGKFARGKAYITTCDMGMITWDDPKPYVVYGTLLIDSCTLRIPEGTQVYVHGGFVRTDNDQEYNDGQIYFLEHGKLLVEGSAEAPVVFQTDRLEYKYDDVSGLWSGLYFVDGSQGNVIRYGVLKNANIGIYLDSAVQIELSHTKFLHNISAGIFARQAQLKAENCLIADSGGYGLFFRYGGNYQLDHCTIANYDNQEEAIYMGNYQCLDPFCSEVFIAPLKARFRNCIFYGNGDDELFFEDASGGEQPELFDYLLTNCLVAVDELLDPGAFPFFFDRCVDCLDGLVDGDKLFRAIDTYDFHPDTASVVIDKGFLIPEITDDLDGKARDGKPDIGCYEFSL